MKILFINDYTAKIGGAEIVAHNLQAALTARGHEIVFIGGEGTKEDFSSLFSRWYSLNWYQKTRKLIQSFHPDIVHIHNCSRSISPSPIVAANHEKIPVLMTLHDFQYFCPKTWGIYSNNQPCPYGFGRRCFLSSCKTFYEGPQYYPYQFLKILKVGVHRLILKHSKISYVAPSAALALNFGESLQAKVTVIRNGVAIPVRPTNYGKNLLFVGRIGKEKGLQTIIGVLNRQSSFKNVILGSGDLKNQLEIGYRNVRFLGFCDPKKWYAKSSIFVLPSLWQENFSTSLIEAMSYGLCVIASNIGGIPEVIIDKETGLLFKPGDESDFQQKLEYLTSNPKEISRIGRNARKLVQNNLSWDKIAKNYETVYRSLS